MATKGQNYGVDIGTGAAGGAAAGAAIGAPFAGIGAPIGAAIGGVVGGVGGAIKAAFDNSEEAKQRAVLDRSQQRRKQEILYNLLRNQSNQYGAWGDTTVPDTIMAEKDDQWQKQSEDSQFAAQHRINPNAFVSMAQSGAQAAGRAYNSLNAPSQATNSPTYPSDFQLSQPPLLSDDPSSYNAPSPLPPPDYQLPQYNPARFLRQDM